MSGAWRKILAWLRDGACIWAPSGATVAYAVWPDDHKRTHETHRVRVRTLHDMDRAGLVKNLSGGTEFSDNRWVLPEPQGRPLIEIL